MICINILVFCNVDLSQKWGDYTRVFSLMKSFSKLGNRVFIVIIRSEHKSPRISSFKENDLDVIEIHPPSIIKLKGRRGVGRYINYLACLPAVSKISRDLIKKYGIDYVYAYMPGIGTSLPAMRISDKHKAKFVLDFADLHVFVRPKKLVESSFRKATKIIALTEYLRKDLIQKGITSDKIAIISNGVDLELFNPDKFSKDEISSLRKSFGASKLVVFSGSLQDLSIIIDSAQQVINKVNDVKFLIIGDHRDPSRSKSAWEQKVISKGLDKHFEFLGKKPREEIPKYLLCADVCIDSFPDEPYYAAAHPIKILEYGACRKPIVATRVSETAKLIIHGKYGYLAKPADVNEYASYIIELLNDASLGEKMGKEFSEFVRKEFSWDYLAKKLEQFLTS